MEGVRREFERVDQETSGRITDYLKMCGPAGSGSLFVRFCAYNTAISCCRTLDCDCVTDSQTVLDCCLSQSLIKHKLLLVRGDGHRPT